VVSPFGTLTFTKQLGRWQLQARLTGQVDTVAWGRHGLTLLAQDSQIGAEIRAGTPSGDTTPAYVFGAADGTRVELGSVQLAAKTALSLHTQSLSLAADVSRAALVIMPGDADGFLASVLPKQGLRADVDLGLAWSSDTGLTLARRPIVQGPLAQLPRGDDRRAVGVLPSTPDEAYEAVSRRAG
jgi:hypothetical protein